MCFLNRCVSRVEKQCHRPVVLDSERCIKRGLISSFYAPPPCPICLKLTERLVDLKNKWLHAGSAKYLPVIIV